MAERWLPCVGRPGYEVSDLGRIRSVDRWIERPVGKGPNPSAPTRSFRRGRVLRPGRSSTGYLTVAIAGQSVPVQWLVAAAFLGPRPDDLMVLHRDGARTNNRAPNLYYGSAAENAADAIRHGTRTRGSRFRSAKLCEWTAACVRALRGWEPQSTLAMLFGVSPAAIQAVHDGRTWTHAPPTSRDAALDWFWSYGPGGTLALDADLKWNAERELERRRGGQ